MGVGAEGAARISLFLLFRCYSVTKSWKPLQEAAFRCNRIRNAALRLRYKTTGHRVCSAIFGRFAGKNLNNQDSSRPAVTLFVTKFVTDDLLRQTESRWVNPPTSEGHRPYRSAPAREVPRDLRSQFPRALIAQLPVSSNLWRNPSPHPARYPKSLPRHDDEHKALFLPQR